MGKVDDKWFKTQGWKEEKYDDTKKVSDYDGYRRRTTIFTKSNKGSHARYDHVIETYFRNGKTTGRSNFYTFYARGNGFEVRNSVTHRKFTDEQILASLKIIGLE